MSAPVPAGRAARTDLDALLGTLVRRVRLGLYLGEFLRFALGGLLLTGCVVLLLRSVTQVRPPRELSYALPLLAAGLAAARALQRSGFDRGRAVAWLDVQLGGSGSLVTEFERRDARWSQRFAERLTQRDALEAARPVASLGTPGALGLLALGFLALALEVRMPAPGGGPSPELAQALVAGLGEKLGLLEDSVRLDEELAQELRERLERLESMGEEGSTESLLASIDTLAERIAAEAQRFDLGLGAAREELAGLAGGLLADPERATESILRAVELARAAGLDLELPPELAALVAQAARAASGAEGAPLDPAQLLQMGLGLSQLLESPLGELVRGGLLDPSQLKQAQGLGELLKRFDPGHVHDESCAEGGG